MKYFKTYEGYAETVGQAGYNVVGRSTADTNPTYPSQTVSFHPPTKRMEEQEEEISNIMYHASPNEYKESILKRGLVPKMGDKQWKENNYPDGIYVFDDLEEAIKYTVLILDGGDVWQIDTTNLDLIVDPESTKDSNFEEANSYYIKENIPKEKIQLIEVSEEKKEEVWIEYQ